MARVTYVKAARASKRERSCRKCGTKIAVGDGYYWWKNRAPGMRSGQMKIQCKDHPPTMADRTPGRRGQLYQLQEDVEKQVAEWTASDATDTDDLAPIAEEAANGLRELGEELQEGADNIEEGFGHSTYQSEEMAQKAQDLESLADDLEDPDFPEPPEEPPEEEPNADDFEDPDEYEDAVTEHENAQTSYEDDLTNWREECGAVITDKLGEADV